MKKKKLEPGQVWQVPDKEWIRVRVIVDAPMPGIPRIWTNDIAYLELGEHEWGEMSTKSFLYWIRQNRARLVGMKDFKTGKVRVVK